MSMCYGNSLVGTSGVNGDSFYISPDNFGFHAFRRCFGSRQRGQGHNVAALRRNGKK